MIVAYLDKKNLTPHIITSENSSLIKQAIWIDLVSPTKEDEVLIEAALEIDIPTREEMIEIELSSRLYKANDTLFMTATMIAHSDSPEPKLEPVTFMLTAQQLITVRYFEPHSFKLFLSRLPKLTITNNASFSLYIELLDATIERLADILEVIGHRLDDYSKKIFRPQHHKGEAKQDYQQLMLQLGSIGDLNTKGRESLITFNRLIRFFGQTASTSIDQDMQSRLNILSKDIAALSDHADFLSSKVNFLLDATLGMIGIEQNYIIKIFSIIAVIFLPPTLIATVYGMNFHFMPGLSTKLGYFVVMGLLVISSWLPYKYFKYRKWL